MSSIPYILIILLWIVAAIFELFGGRAARFADTPIDIKLPLMQLKALLMALSKPYIFIWLFFLIINIFFGVKNRKKRSLSELNLIFNNLIGWLVILTIYLIGLCSKVAYLSRLDASIGLWLVLNLILVVLVYKTITMLMQIKWKSNKIGIISYILILFLCIYPDGKYKPSIFGNENFQTAFAVNQEIIKQFLEVEVKGTDEVYLHIPDYSGTQLEALMNEGIGECIQDTLFAHGVIQRKVDIVVFKDFERWTEK